MIGFLDILIKRYFDLQRPERNLYKAVMQKLFPLLFKTTPVNYFNKIKFYFRMNIRQRLIRLTLPITRLFKTIKIYT